MKSFFLSERKKGTPDFNPFPFSNYVFKRRSNLIHFIKMRICFDHKFREKEPSNLLIFLKRGVPFCLKSSKSSGNRNFVFRKRSGRNTKMRLATHSHHDFISV